MKLISWNVNGIRAILKKNFLEFVKSEKPDVLCVQETKAHPDQVDKMLEEYEHHFWNSAEKKGYSGTAVFSRVKPVKVCYGIGCHEHDKEGRVLTVEFAKFTLVNVYTPNAQPGLARINYRVKWDKAFLSYCKKLEKERGKPVVFCGDLNVAHNEIDIARPAANMNSPGFSPKEREGFDNMVESGFVDTFRYFHPEKIKYSWWSYRTKARERGVGWRIDYFNCSKKFVSQVKSADILDKVMGSDHCPVRLVLK